MIKIPKIDREEKVFLFEALFVFMLIVLFLASFAIISYWYIFGAKNPFAEKVKKEKAEEEIIYVNPNYELQNLMLNKFIVND